MHIERGTYGRPPSHWDLPDWEEVKLTTLGFLANNPAVSASTVATLSTKRAIEKATGKKLTAKEVESIKAKNDTIVGKELADSFTAFFTRIKWIIIGLVILVLVLKFK